MAKFDDANKTAVTNCFHEGAEEAKNVIAGLGNYDTKNAATDRWWSYPIQLLDEVVYEINRIVVDVEDIILGVVETIKAIGKKITGAIVGILAD